MANFVRRQRRLRYAAEGIPIDRRTFRDRLNPLEVYSAEEIRDRYRFYPETIVFICDLVEDDLHRTTNRSQPLCTMLAVLVSLHFLATNAHHIVTAAVHGVGRPSVSRAIFAFCTSLCRQLNRFVSFPTEQEAVRNVQCQFYAIAGFPNVVGAVDGTHVKIQAPSTDENDYVNRKGYHSINVQMICDSTFRVVDVVAKWPGSVHDARIFRESDICARFERGELEGLLLGDSGYACKKYLLTPYLATPTQAKERYNIALCKTRVLIEQTFGVIKRRFPCLSYGLRTKPERSIRIIGACVVLHNIGINNNDMFARNTDDSQVVPETEEQYQGPGTGAHYREFITNAFFS